MRLMGLLLRLMGQTNGQHHETNGQHHETNGQHHETNGSTSETNRHKTVRLDFEHNWARPSYGRRRSLITHCWPL